MNDRGSLIATAAGAAASFGLAEINLLVGIVAGLFAVVIGFRNVFPGLWARITAPVRSWVQRPEDRPRDVPTDRPD